MDGWLECFRRIYPAKQTGAVLLCNYGSQDAHMNNIVVVLLGLSGFETHQFND
jgi:hypothetical protein